jgi:hypothetical protein
MPTNVTTPIMDRVQRFIWSSAALEVYNLTKLVVSIPRCGEETAAPAKAPSIPSYMLSAPGIKGHNPYNYFGMFDVECFDMFWLDM